MHRKFATFLPSFACEDANYKMVPA